MTNGEKMQEMFPEGKIRRCKGGVVFESDGWCHAYDSDWWNTEHKEPTTKNNLGVEWISRDSAIKALDYDIKCFEFKSGVSKHMDDIVKLLNTIYETQVNNIKALSSVKPQEPIWIPVNERLPEENKTVIASTKYGVYPEARYSKEDGWEWAYESGADYWEEIACEVLAWMLLPQPYSEVTE